MRLSRRQMLAGAVASLGSGALADVPVRSYRPVARVPLADAITGLIARAGLSGRVAVVLGDPVTGGVLESHSPALPLPPASVTKAFTALYALESLGDAHRSVTRVLARGAVVGGVVQGDLILAGGGDPDLVTDDLAQLAQALRAVGITGVTGDFAVWGGALARVDQIDPGQQPQLGYNPALGGLNLNYNRVHFSWARSAQGVTAAMDARSDNYRPAVTSSRIRIVDRDLPVFTFARDGDVDAWTVARSALNADGSRWLPVRNPALYAGDVFATLARAQGIALPPARRIAALPATTELARVQSRPLPAVLTAMLRYSTNITAEALGLTATGRIAGAPQTLAISAQSMAQWAAQRAPGIAPSFLDHSGLGDGARVTAADLVGYLQARDVRARLRPLLRDIALVDADRKPINAGGAVVQAKTGTLNFVAALSGYLRSARGRDLCFAIMAADLPARARGKALPDEVPPDARSWNTAARRLQQQILQHWALRAY